jgi:hypothetical protein
MNDIVSEFRELLGGGAPPSDPVQEFRRLLGPSMRPQRRPEIQQVDPRIAEQEQMRANMLPPSANPDTIPRASAGTNPATMSAIDVPRRAGVPVDADVIFVAENGGQVLRGPDGSLSYVDDIYSTTDPERVMDILRNQPPGEVYSRGYSADIVSQNPVAARAATAIEGVPFVGSYGDEVAGLVGGQAAQDAWRASVGSMENAYPGQSMALKTAGTVAGTLPIAAAAAGAPVLQGATRGARMVAAGLTGAAGAGVEGAIYGAGMQQGEGRAANARNNAVAGVIGGGVLGAMVPLADDFVQGLVGRHANSAPQLIADDLGISIGAANVLSRALRADDPVAAVQRLQRQGSGAMLADAGTGASSLLDAAISSGGGVGTSARNEVEARITREFRDLTQVLDEALGSPVGRETASRQIREGTRDARQEVYDRAYGQPINYATPDGERVLNLARRVDPRAVEYANRLIQADNAARIARGQEPRPDQILVQVGDDGTLEFSELPSVRQVHFIMQGLNQLARGGETTGALGGRTPLSNALEGQRSGLGRALGTAVPDFRAAQSAFADIARESELVESGYGLLRMTSSQARETFRGIPPGERTAARQGVRDFIFDQVDATRRIASDPNHEARQLREAMDELTSDRSRTNLRIILGQREADRLFEQVDRAMGSLELRAAIARNSKTDIRGDINEEVIAQSRGPILEELMSAGRPAEAARRAVQIFTGDSSEAQILRSQGMMEEIARVLTGARGETAQQALAAIQRAQRGNSVSVSEAELIGRVLNREFAYLARLEGQRQLETR